MMTYSCSDFTDSILDALGIDTTGIEEDVSAQADAALEAIDQQQQLIKDLWRFIENDPARSEQFFKLRERVRDHR